ncbi:fungal-specific transcription factor domain-containing protein [Mycena leptocephala]|nr:fungal-specific transcription factor domain-containing protein [Mycena leptocephala]
MDPKTTLPDGNGACEPRPKLRRLQGACDVCKKRKSDSAQLPGNRCTHCTTFGLDCTHADLLKVRLKFHTFRYVSALESRVEKMEMLLTKERGIDFTEQLENENEVEPLLHQPEGTLPRNDENNTLSESLGKLKLNPENNRFFGKSSGIQLVQTALNFQGGLCHFKHSLRGQKREEFWKVPPWIVPPPGDDSTQYTFPDSDLLPALVHLYFKEVNPFWPVLHRPTFDRKVADKLHLRDHRFGTTLLMVCSLGARYSDDPRVLLDGYGGPPFHTAGWKWHSQVCAIPKDLIYKPDLYELQTIALSAVYLQIISPTALSWNQIGFGLRRAQDVGAHRRRSEQHPTAENEQWKRVFWYFCILCSYWLAGTLSGRPLAMHDQDFDQDLPVECDDEYWNLHEPQNFKQPKDKPSDLSYFICYAKLLEIQAAVATAIYSPRKPKDLCGRPFPSTEAQYIVGFDSALNSWLNNVPEHLRWDPERKNQLHLTQSALLCTAFYNVQILLHRPFIPTPLETLRSGARPSFTICANAARSCVRIFDTYERRGIPLNYNIPAAFAAGIVLLLNAWSGTKSGFAYNPSKELDQVYSCLRVMTEAEERCELPLIFCTCLTSNLQISISRPLHVRIVILINCLKLKL